MDAEAPAKAGERKFVGLVLDGIEQDGSFSGYASLFGKVDLGKDVVERGAFAASLSKRGAAGIRMLFQHDPNQPIGTWAEIREDARGLFVRVMYRQAVFRMSGSACPMVTTMAETRFNRARAAHSALQGGFTLPRADLCKRFAFYCE